MSQELNELSHLLFPGSTQENAEYFSEITEYIKKLGSQNWTHIQKEPERLTEEMNQLTEQTQDLAFTNYKTFVETAEISRTIMKDLGNSKSSLMKFLEATPNFIQECESFSQMAGNIIKEKSRYSAIRNQSEKLLELLELPALMREALSAEDYESALDIFTFIRNLSKRYSEIPLVQNTTSEIMTLWFETLYHLFNQLRYDLPLPQCLQVIYEEPTPFTDLLMTKITFHMQGAKLIRQMDCTYIFLKQEMLGLKKLWRMPKIQNVGKFMNLEAASERLLRRIVELHRIHLFNVLTQHKSIFLSDAQDSRAREDELNGTSALSCWLKQKVETLALILNQDLQGEDESNFESLFNQCMYLCLSFGRVGADMRCTLTPLFRNNLLTQFYKGLEKAENHFDNQMRSYKVPTIKNVPRPINENAGSSPPESLLDYYPLAEYCNGMLIVLNMLRVTAPLNIVKEVYNAYRSSFKKAVQVLMAFYQREQQAFTDIERQNFVSLCVCFTEDFVPYISKCLSLSFPSTQIAELLGVTLTVLQESKMLYIDQISTCEPLNSITGIVIN